MLDLQYIYDHFFDIWDLAAPQNRCPEGLLWQWVYYWILMCACFCFLVTSMLNYPRVRLLLVFIGRYLIIGKPKLTVGKVSDFFSLESFETDVRKYKPGFRSELSAALSLTKHSKLDCKKLAVGMARYHCEGWHSLCKRPFFCFNSKKPRTRKDLVRQELPLKAKIHPKRCQQPMRKSKSGQENGLIRHKPRLNTKASITTKEAIPTS